MAADTVANEIEAHEAEMWGRMIEATAAVPGNPLGARVDWSGSVPLFSLAALNFGLFNRVVSLGIDSPATDAELDRILTWFRDLGQSGLWIEVTPAAQPADLRERLVARGLGDTGGRQAKTCCVPRAVAADPSIAVAELGAADRDEFAACNVAAWGVSDALLPWFGATIGVDGFRHFGVREGGRIVSTGSLYVSDGIAWLGYGATYPEFRGRGYQTALMAHRLNEAWRLGCRLAHSETAEDSPEHRNPSLHNMHRLGLETVYVKELWAPA